MNTAKKLLANTLLLTFSSLIMRVISLGYQVYISKTLGAEGMGLFQLVMSVYGLALTLGSMGIRVTSTCLISKEQGMGGAASIRKTVKACLAYAGVISTLAASAMLILSPQLAAGWIGDERSLLSIRLCALGLPVTVLSSVMAGYFMATGKVGRLVFAELTERLLSIAITAYFIKAYGNGGIEAACGCVVAGGELSTAFSFAVLLSMYVFDVKNMPNESKKAPPVFRQVVTMAIPIGAGELIRSGLGTVEHTMIPKGLKSYGAGDGEALAQYGLIHGMVFPIIFFPAAILQSLAEVLIPELSASQAENRPNRIRYIVSHVMQLCFLFAALCSAVCFSTGGLIGEAIYDNSELSDFFIPFAPLVIFMYMDAIVDSMLKGLGQHIYNVRLNTATSIIDIILLMVLLPKYGIRGYIMAFAITKTINFSLSLLKIAMISGYRPGIRLPVLSFMGIVLSAGLTELLFPVTGTIIPIIILRGGFTIVCFCLTMYLSGAVTGKDLQWLYKIIRKKG